jgi:arsenical pump membrane protein
MFWSISVSNKWKITMNSVEVSFTIAIFLLSVIFLIWRPFRLNESLPTAAGAALLFITGIISLLDIYHILGTVSGPVLTILSTIVMSIVLESIGFFRWTAHNLVIKARGSGIRLFWYINLLCYLMTLFFNNDGSILITTPIIIYTMNMLKLKPLQKIPYLLSGAFIATSSSAPIGVSNLANLISIKIVGLDLISYTTYLFIPAMLGITTIALLMFAIYKKHIPRKIANFTKDDQIIHFPRPYNKLPKENIAAFTPDWKLFRICFTIVVLTRISLFVVSPFGIPPELPSVIGAMMLIAVRRYLTGVGAWDVVRRTPWHTLIFAFSMYVLAYGLLKVGLSDLINNEFREHIVHHHFKAIFIMGLLMTVLSNILNNLPSVMIATLSLTNMHLDLPVLQLSYLASVIGADIGSLILPMGTLATLMWMFILREHHIHFSWWQYTKIAIIVIPAGLLVSLISLYMWSEILRYFNY